MTDGDDCGISDLPNNKNTTITKAFIVLLGLNDNAESWSLILQQLLIFVLIIGRWILPRGNITGDQLSQLLLMYVGSGADILEFSSEGLRLDKIGCDSTVIYTILTIWTCSLFQFTLPLTVKKRSRPRPSAKGLLKIKHAVSTCCATEIWAILVTVLLQDGPFLVVRLYLMIDKKVINELLLFFACKNFLAILLQGNRLRVLLKEKRLIRRSLRNRFALRLQWGAARNIEKKENEPDDIENGTINHESNESHNEER
ncbi:transmembrane protein 26-like [Anneissia japonica]|uniref:transmembrane protein 26-like n=1 Tax=Anneissia japonica TaxID=1529436 RepID=UPI00142596B9|nr:transmembrane protein 26-like [Anneissia japonica]